MRANAPRTAPTWLTLLAGMTVLPALSGLAFAQLPAFPRAVGFGAVTTGGRGGRVIHVTTLAASGTGSLAAAIAATGPRIVVFDVSGVIRADIEIANGDVTIAGQTAPGAGITINGHLSTPYGDAVENIIIRHVRIRPPGAGGAWPAEQHDAILMSDTRRVVFDHVDVSHGIDENVDHYDGARDITWQNSILSFANPSGGHPEGAHAYCLLNFDGDEPARGGYISIIGNLFAHCRSRNPALGKGPAEVINNVIYDVREGFVHHNAASGDFVIAGNYYKSGSEDLAPFWFDAENDNPPSRYFMGDNWVDDPGVFTGRVDNPNTTNGFADEYSVLGYTVRASQFYPLADAPSWGAPRVPAERLSPDEAHGRVLDCAGAWPRDAVSRAAVEEARMRTGSIRNLSISNLMDGLTPGTPPPDGDGDGMPDAWETARGLNPATDDHNMPLDGGWPAIELYLEERAAEITCPGSTPLPTGAAGASGGGGGTSGGGTGAGGATGGGGTSGGAGISGGAGVSGAGGTSGPGGEAGLIRGGCNCGVGGATPGPGLGLLLALAAGLLGRRRARPAERDDRLPR